LSPVVKGLYSIEKRELTPREERQTTRGFIQRERICGARKNRGVRKTYPRTNARAFSRKNSRRPKKGCKKKKCGATPWGNLGEGGGGSKDNEPEMRNVARSEKKEGVGRFEKKRGVTEGVPGGQGNATSGVGYQGSAVLGKGKAGKKRT